MSQNEETTRADFEKMIAYFSDARNVYIQNGDIHWARKCDDAIAAAQNFEIAKSFGILKS